MDLTPLRWAALVYAGFGMSTTPNSKLRVRQSLVAEYRGTVESVRSLSRARGSSSRHTARS